MVPDSQREDPEVLTQSRLPKTVWTAPVFVLSDLPTMGRLVINTIIVWTQSRVLFHDPHLLVCNLLPLSVGGTHANKWNSGLARKERLEKELVVCIREKQSQRRRPLPRDYRQVWYFRSDDEQYLGCIELRWLPSMQGRQVCGLQGFCICLSISSHTPCPLGLDVA